MRIDPHGTPPLEVTDVSVVYRENDGANFTVERAEVQDKATGNRFSLHYASVKDGKTGAVCVVFHKDRLLLAKHWRVSIGEWEWEFPRGMGDSSESAEQTAVRELHEETGLHAELTDVRRLGYIHADTGVLKDDIAVVLLEIPDATMPESTHDWELKDPLWLLPAEVETMIADNEIRDGITLAAWSLWQAACRRQL